jgi:hypothetical protein
MLLGLGCAQISGLNPEEDLSSRAIYITTDDIPQLGDIVQWAGSPSLHVEGKAQDIHKAETVSGKNIDISIEIYPASAKHVAALFWMDQQQAIKAILCKHLRDDAGAYRNNSLYTCQIPADQLNAGEYKWWLRVTKQDGKFIWISNNGKNYRFTVTNTNSASWNLVWAGNWNTAYIHNSPRYVGDQDPLVYEQTLDGSRTALCMYIEVYIPGLSDQNYPNHDAMRQAAENNIKSEVWSNLAGDPSPESWGAMPLSFEGKSGNNFKYGWCTWKVYHDGGTYPHNPPDGCYKYKFRFSVDGGNNWKWFGRTDGKDRRIIWARSNADAISCGTTPPVPVGWVGNLKSNFSRGGCDYGYDVDLVSPLIYSSWVLTRAVCRRIRAEVWIPGVTDKNIDPAQITAEIQLSKTDANGRATDWNSIPMQYENRNGKNYRYYWDLGMPNYPYQPTQENWYYFFRFRYQNGPWSQLGQDGRANSSVPFVLRYDY